MVPTSTFLVVEVQVVSPRVDNGTGQRVNTVVKAEVKGAGKRLAPFCASWLRTSADSRQPTEASSLKHSDLPCGLAVMADPP